MASIRVTGGAGYIGSHICKALSGAGYMPVTYDNLSRGHRDFVRWGPFEYGDVRDGARLDQVLAAHRPTAAIHLAAFAYVAESVAYPLTYYDNNVVGSLRLMQALVRGGIDRIVFSSTCAVYGSPNEIPISEATEPGPINPYGFTKLAVERMILQVASATHLGYVILRYFNAAGADPDGEIGESHDPEPHLIPSVIARTLSGDSVSVFGMDYPTADGTCVRDYIHVTDLAEAHVRAVTHLMEDKGSMTVNLGANRGVSVLEIVNKVGSLIGRRPRIAFLPRRSGDPPVLVAGTDLARARLNWSPRYSELNLILSSAIAWHHRSTRS
jgi:UDP-arabinose 4-epimerase